MSAGKRPQCFLFTGSPRSFHSLAMTRGTKYPSPHHSCHSRTLSRHPGIGPPQTQMCLWGDSRPGSIAFPWMFEIIGYVCMFPLLRIIIISMDPGLRRDDKLQITNTCTPHSLTTPPQPPTKIAFSRGPVSCHPSNGGELGTFPSRNKVPLCGGVARVSVTGWFITRSLGEGGNTSN